MQPLNGETQSTSLPVWRALWGIYIRQPADWSHWSDLAGKRIGILQNDWRNALFLRTRRFNATATETACTMRWQPGRLMP